MRLIPALKGLRQGDLKLEANLLYLVKTLSQNKYKIKKYSNKAKSGTSDW